MPLDAATLDSSEGALAAATHAIFIGGSEIAHKDGLKMGQPVHYWNKMPFSPGLYQASVGDKLSFLFNTEHTVWLMPSADASDSCDFTNAVELAGPTYGLPDWPELGSGDIKLGEANWPLSPLHQHLAGRLGRPLSAFDHDPPNGLDTTWGPFTWVAVIVGPLFAVACITVFVYQIGAGNDWCRREKKEKDAPKPNEIDAPEREVHL